MRRSPATKKCAPVHLGNTETSRNQCRQSLLKTRTESVKTPLIEMRNRKEWELRMAKTLKMALVSPNDPAYYTTLSVLDITQYVQPEVILEYGSTSPKGSGAAFSGQLIDDVEVVQRVLRNGMWGVTPKRTQNTNSRGKLRRYM
ncbi:hypothetical protein HNY73_002577 [Argiope bruennichi]|uniref:Uncharacterized protein n=1 Tax=Argiope bruennichi TaxID=94029 RepID=A0A8T0FYD7_ARGBR|nr:hypothetical protein HNY73_002577 [Argiope bruennichi]